jgi:predicted GNAT family acetyltransferase
MLVLFDNGTPRGIARELQDHTVKEAREQGWDVLRNGDLLDVAEAAGFDVLVTTDKIVAAVNAATVGTYTEVDIPSIR